MRFVIATLPDVKFNLGRDLNLVKAASLYAEDAVLFSPTYSGTEPLLSFSNRPLLHQLIYLGMLFGDPGFKEGEELTDAEREARIAKAKRTRKEFLSKAYDVLQISESAESPESGRKQLLEIANEIHRYVDIVERVWSEDSDLVRRARELEKAQQAGLVRIEQIIDRPDLYYSQRKLEEDVKRALSQADSYGALDERFIAEFGTLSSGSLHNVRAARLATDLLARLPGFSEATVDELIDIRQELAPHVVGFRKAILDLSTEIQSVPWDTDFPFEVERELHRRVYPSVAEIEAKISENSYLKEILHRAAKDPFVIPASSAFGLLLSNATQSSGLIAQIASSVAGAGLIAYEALEDWRANRREIEGNEFFFYYRASALLQKHTN